MPVTVEIVGSRIHLTGWAGEQTKFKCKAVPGATARWDKSVHPNKFLCWTYPIDFNTCLELRRQFGLDLNIGPDLAAWAREEKKKREGVTKILKQSTFDLPLVEEAAPNLGAAMAVRSYQQVGAAFLRAVERGIIADEPGLGKTLQIMGAVVEAGIVGPILVLGPSAAIQITWPTELAHWLPDDRVYVAVGNRRQREAVIARHERGLVDEPDKRHWLLCNFEMARAHQGRPKITKLCPEEGPFKWTKKDPRSGKIIHGKWHHPYAYLFQVKWETIVCDESQKALVTKTPKKEDQPQARAGIGMLRIEPHGLRIAASGTPFRGKVYNLWGTLNWIRPEVYSSFWNWVQSWFEVAEAEYSLEIGGLRSDKEEQFYRELDTLMIRRKKIEVVKELPPKQYAGAPLDPTVPGSLYGIWLDMDPKQERAYQEMVREAAASLDSGQLLATGVLAELTRLKQFSTCYGDIETRMRKLKGLDEMEDYTAFLPGLPSNKFDWLADWLEERGHFDGEPNNPVVVASQFTSVINLFRYELEKQFGLKSHVLTGETKSKDRLAAKEAFQDGTGHSVFFLNTDAGGTSLTLDKADDLIFLDEKWIPDDQTQVEDRIHRVSRMHQVTIWYLRSLGTIEEHIASVNEDRDSIQGQILDGRRGVEFAKKLLGGS
jgi:SNF2 family DNA or RNA helicase